MLDDLLPDLDHVLVMSVNPGFAAQKFLPYSKDKLTALRRTAQERGLDLALEVDGGVKANNAAACGVPFDRSPSSSSATSIRCIQLNAKHEWASQGLKQS